MFTLFVRFYYMFDLSLRLTIEVFLVFFFKQNKKGSGKKIGHMASRLSDPLP